MSDEPEPTPVETVNGWRLNTGAQPEPGRRVDVLYETGITLNAEIVPPRYLPRTGPRPVIAWRYTE